MKIRVEPRSPAYVRVIIDNPPLNLFDPEMADGLEAMMARLESDRDVKVVVFESANPDFFIAHIDLLRISEFRREPGPTGLSQWPDVASRLQASPFITVGLLRGRARGVGSEFLQALDVRFASRERAVLSQLELATGVIPGGGGLERLPALVGRSRAIEIVVGAEDVYADTAERYGWINRAIPDAELDAFVERFALRVAGFHRDAIAAAKQIINQRCGLPKESDLTSTQNRFFQLAASEDSQRRVASLVRQGLQQVGDLELHLGDRVSAQAASR